MTERLNVISVVCHVSLDVIDESNKTNAQNIILKNNINQLFNIAFQYIGQTNRIILVTDSGAELAYLGPPQDAMLMAEDILSGILISNKTGSVPLSVRIGIHLKPVKKLKDLNEQSNIIGNGISAARKLVREAKVNEINVSRSYGKNSPTSNQTQSAPTNQIFDRLENHVPDYQANLEKLSLELTPDAIILDLPVKSTISLQPEETTINIQPAITTNVLKTNNLKYAFASLLMVFLLFSTVELVNKPSDTLIKDVKTLPIRKSQSSKPITAAAESEMTSQPDFLDDKSNIAPQYELKLNETVKPFPAKKKAQQNTKNSADSSSTKAKTNPNINWETVKKSLMQGQKRACTQSEIAMNQCR